jgi:hypothetical protein
MRLNSMRYSVLNEELSQGKMSNTKLYNIGGGTAVIEDTVVST